MTTYLAIDYGTKRVGVAINTEWLAEPVAVFPTNQAVSSILSLIQQRNINHVLIGIADGVMADEARKFAVLLQKEVPSLCIHEADETLTSVETHEKLATSGMKQKKRQGDIDHYAAAAILQNYLDTYPKHTREK